MRFWQDAKGSLIDDDGLLAYIAAHGSLSGALASGDITLVADASRDGDSLSKGSFQQASKRVSAGDATRPRKHLVDYL